MRRRLTFRSVAEVDADVDGGARFVLGEYRLENDQAPTEGCAYSRHPSWLEPETVLWFRT